MTENPEDPRMGGRPLLILDEESERTHGEDAQSMNIQAGQAVAEAVRTTLGPNGMDKMLVDSMGDVVMTNDGVTILDEMDIEHPAAEMVVEVAESQEDETGDGTNTGVVLTGELLDGAADLLEQDVHPQTIVSGYLDAAGHAVEYLDDKAIEVDTADEETLRAVAGTAMTGKIPAGGQDRFVDLAVEAVRTIAEEGSVNLDHLEIETIAGGGVDNSRLIEGVTVDKDPVHPDMPVEVSEARIALIDTAIEVEETETDIEATVTDPEQLERLAEHEEAQLREMAETITETGATVVFCSKGIDDMAQHFLAEEGVLAVRRASSSDKEHLARAAGGDLVADIDDLSEGDLGQAGHVEQRTIGDEEYLFVEDCDDPRTVTLLLRGGTEHVVEGAERAIQDALDVLALVVEDNRIVPGGGAPETALALELRDYADGVEGREQLAIEAFADALEVVPRLLAETSGLDPIDSLVDLRSRQADEDFTAGLDTDSGAVVDMIEEGIVEPLRVKTNAIASAKDAANMIVRIDDVIAAGGEEAGEMPGAGGSGGPPGGPGGMPGAPPGGPGGMPGGMDL